MPDHLKLDTEFLDIKEPIKGPAKDPNWVFSGKAPESEKSKKSSGKPFTHNWKLILLAVGIVLLISWAAVTQDNSSSSNTATPANAPTSNSTGQTLNLNSQNNTVVVGHYTCSSYDADQADSLQPSDAVSKQLDADEKNLEDRAAALKTSKEEIDGTTVDNTDQSSLDSYNQMVDNYNATLNTWKSDSKAHDVKITQFNAQVKKYNNYLDANCTKNN